MWNEALLSAIHFSAKLSIKVYLRSTAHESSLPPNIAFARCTQSHRCCSVSAHVRQTSSPKPGWLEPCTGTTCARVPSNGYTCPLHHRTLFEGFFACGRGDCCYTFATFATFATSCIRRSLVPRPTMVTVGSATTTTATPTTTPVTTSGDSTRKQCLSCVLPL